MGCKLNSLLKYFSFQWPRFSISKRISNWMCFQFCSQHFSKMVFQIFFAYSCLQLGRWRANAEFLLNFQTKVSKSGMYIAGCFSFTFAAVLLQQFNVKIPHINRRKSPKLNECINNWLPIDFEVHFFRVQSPFFHASTVAVPHNHNSIKIPLNVFFS